MRAADSAAPPIPESYWVEPGRVLAGPYPLVGEEAMATRLRRLLESGVDCFIDLTEPGELPPYESLLPGPYSRTPISYLRKPIRDHGLPASMLQMQEILDELAAALEEGRRIYLHCRAGVGRTNLVAGCWFASSGSLGDAALATLNLRWLGSALSEAWPRVPETEAQREYVRSWRPRRVQPVSPRPPAPASATAPARDLRDRARGMLLGIAMGEALLHARHDLPAGAWADTAAMMLCLAESYIRSGGHDAADQVRRYQGWQRLGYWSSTGRCVGISDATARALATAQWHGNPYAGSHDPAQASAEPLARIAPAVIWHRDDARTALEAAVQCARVTHQAPLTLDAVRYFAALLAGALAGAPKQALLAPMFSPQPGLWDSMTLRPRVHEVASGGWRGAHPGAVEASDSPAAALAAALAVFAAGAGPAAVLQAAAAVDAPALPVAALAGALAGAHYGAAALPADRRAGLARASEIEAQADALVARAVPGAAR
ncbi:MAG: ADP-ribosylglycohydrolase family protein [Gammaproteobacteria bacterium]